MEDIKFTIDLPPITKKNSQRILYRWSKNKKTGVNTKIPYIAPSEAYEKYAKMAAWFIRGKLRELKISAPVNVKCVYYMPTKRRVDLVNLQEATLDIMVDNGVLADDRSEIVCSMDGSRVFYSRDRPRTEVTITFYDQTHDAFL